MADAHLDALRMLARRELSEAQLRQRLARRDHSPDDIDIAIATLKSNGSVDDARTAGVIARTEATGRGRGHLRVKQRLQAAGIGPALAEQAARDAFRDVDVDALVETALQKRLRGRERAADDREYARLHRHLLRQGFEPDRVARVIRKYQPR